MRFITVHVLVIFLVSAIASDSLATKQPVTKGTDNGSPLFLTPFIENGQIEEGRELAKVVGVVENVDSYSGFLTVDATYNSNIFFWFVPAKYSPETAPVMLWLQGGPGLSSMFGLFVEQGPFKIDADMNPSLRDTTWTDSYSMIYVDNPVGTGFSFTDNELGYARTQEDVAQNVYATLSQFFTLFPDYAPRPFYIAGESYGGKYSPVLALKIDAENSKPENQAINLAGVALWAPYSDPVSCIRYGDHLYGASLIGAVEREHFLAEEATAIDAIGRAEWRKAFEIMDRLMDGVYQPSYFGNVTGYSSYFNYLTTVPPPEHSYWIDYLGQEDVRVKIHVGDLLFSHFGAAALYLENDLYQSVLPQLETLLDSKYPVLILTGQLDIIVPAVALDEIFNKANWAGREDFLASPRQQLKINGHLAGYVRQNGTLTYVTLLGGGHFLPYDQPTSSYEVVKKFTSDNAVA